MRLLEKFDTSGPELFRNCTINCGKGCEDSTCSVECVNRCSKIVQQIKTCATNCRDRTCDASSDSAECSACLQGCKSLQGQADVDLISKPEYMKGLPGEVASEMRIDPQYTHDPQYTQFTSDFASKLLSRLGIDTIEWHSVLLIFLGIMCICTVLCTSIYIRRNT